MCIEFIGTPGNNSLRGSGVGTQHRGRQIDCERYPDCPLARSEARCRECGTANNRHQHLCTYFRRERANHTKRCIKMQFNSTTREEISKMERQLASPPTTARCLHAQACASGSFRVDHECTWPRAARACLFGNISFCKFCTSMASPPPAIPAESQLRTAFASSRILRSPHTLPKHVMYAKNSYAKKRCGRTGANGHTMGCGSVRHISWCAIRTGGQYLPAVIIESKKLSSVHASFITMVA